MNILKLAAWIIFAILVTSFIITFLLGMTILMFVVPMYVLVNWVGLDHNYAMILVLGTWLIIMMGTKT